MLTIEATSWLSPCPLWVVQNTKVLHRHWRDHRCKSWLDLKQHVMFHLKMYLCNSFLPPLGSQHSFCTNSQHFFFSWLAQEGIYFPIKKYYQKKDLPFWCLSFVDQEGWLVVSVATVFVHSFFIKNPQIEWEQRENLGTEKLRLRQEMDCDLAGGSFSRYFHLVYIVKLQQNKCKNSLHFNSATLSVPP